MKKYTFAAKNLLYDVSRLGTNAKPVQRTRNVENNVLRGCHWVDIPNTFNRSAVTTSASVDRNDVVERSLLTTAATQAEFYHDVSSGNKV